MLKAIYSGYLLRSIATLIYIRADACILTIEKQKYKK